MENRNTNEVIIDDFNKIALLPDVWNHNKQYHKYLLQHIGAMKESGIDIGCGRGSLTKELCKYCNRVTGIDISPVMIEEAKKLNNDDNISYLIEDAHNYLDKNKTKYDVIISVATLHHMDFGTIIKKCKEALNPGGILIVLDLYKDSTVKDYFLSGISVLLHPIFCLIKRGRINNTKEERELWNAHGKSDEYNTMKEIKEYADKISGNYSLKNHLFWRYSLIYRNDSSAPSGD